MAVKMWGMGGGQGVLKDGFCTQWETLEGYGPPPASTPVVLKYPRQLFRYLISKFTPRQDNHRGQKTKPLKADDHLPTWAELQFLLNSLCNFFLDKEAQKMLSGSSRPSAVSLDTLSNSPPSPLF